jgi:hypothetical protein
MSAAGAYALGDPAGVEHGLVSELRPWLLLKVLLLSEAVLPSSPNTKLQAGLELWLLKRVTAGVQDNCGAACSAERQQHSMAVSQWAWQQQQAQIAKQHEAQSASKPGLRTS